MPHAPSTPGAAGPAAGQRDRTPAIAAAWLLGCFALAYGFDVGRGFISDDFGWIAHSRSLSDAGTIRRLFVETPMGFYRPMVSVSFAANERLFGADPLGYALTNVALVLAIAAALIRLIEGFGFGRGPALFGAALWLFNVHGIGMSLTWISGRTSLLATLFAVLAAIAVRRDRPRLAGMWVLAALLSKEEPILLPVVLAAWVALDAPRAGERPRAALADVLRATWPSFAALGVYLALRFQSTAMTPGTAPSYYALSWSPRVLAPNMLSYLDRAGTVSAAVLLLGVLVFSRRLPRPDAAEWRAVRQGAIWAVLGFALTVMVPVRSDLYACYPSIGVALMAAAAGSALWRAIPPHRRRAALAGGLLLPLALVPVYRARNAPNRRLAILSTRIVGHVAQALAARDDLTRVDLFQTQGERPSAGAALGGTLPLAINWRTGRHVAAEIHEVAAAAASSAPPPGALHVRIDRGEIVSVASPR